MDDNKRKYHLYLDSETVDFVCGYKKIKSVIKLTNWSGKKSLNKNKYTIIAEVNAENEKEAFDKFLFNGSLSHFPFYDIERYKVEVNLTNKVILIRESFDEGETYISSKKTSYDLFKEALLDGVLDYIILEF